MPLKLKPQFADVVIGFNNSSLPLGKRKDLDKLYEIGKANKTQSILEMFEEVPEAKELDAIKAANFNEKRNEKFDQKNK